MQLILGKKMTPVGDELGFKDRSLIFFFFPKGRTSYLTSDSLLALHFSSYAIH